MRKKKVPTVPCLNMKVVDLHDPAEPSRDVEIRWNGRLVFAGCKDDAIDWLAAFVGPDGSGIVFDN